MNNKNIPYHIGIIIDGNRRWAKKRNLPTLEGHRRGFDLVKKAGDWLWQKGVKIVTIYCFSTENWNRTKSEINYLMKLLSIAFDKKEIERYNKKGIKIQVIGQKQRLSKTIQEKIENAEKLTKNNKKGVLNLAISYGGRTEIINAVKQIVKKKISADRISEDLISKNLWTKDIPDPDLIIRTGGRQRLSNFLTWQTVYSEIYFLDKYWPDFNEKDLDKILKYYSTCQKNFGR